MMKTTLSFFALAALTACATQQDAVQTTQQDVAITTPAAPGGSGTTSIPFEGTTNVVLFVESNGAGWTEQMTDVAEALIRQRIASHSQFEVVSQDRTASMKSVSEFGVPEAARLMGKFSDMDNVMFVTLTVGLDMNTVVNGSASADFTVTTQCMDSTGTRVHQNRETGAVADNLTVIERAVQELHQSALTRVMN